MREVETSIEIDAPVRRVWDVITDFRAWDEWNPVITRMRAMPSPKTPVSFTIALAGRELKIRGEMLEVEPGRALRWHGPPGFVISRLGRAEHYISVEPKGPSRCKLVHGERFEGALIPVIWGRLRPVLEAAYGEMNQALARRAESVGAWVPEARPPK